MLKQIWPQDIEHVGDGYKMLKLLASGTARAAFFDPQYRALNDRQAYGDEKTGRMAKVHALPGMPRETICNMLLEIERVLAPWGHCFLWIDKLMLVEGVCHYLQLSNLQPVDMITWDKVRIGMGYRSRRRSEYLVVLQKPWHGEIRARGCWIDRGIPDVWQETAVRGMHPHAKPLGLIKRLIECVTDVGDAVVDPAAGSFGVLEACQQTGRRFYGCDLIHPEVYR